MQRWEYKVVSLRDGEYTQALNEYGADGWELVSVAPVVQEAPAAGSSSVPGIPMPRVWSKLGETAAAWNRWEAGEAAAPEPGSTSTTLLWVLRRPLGDD